MLVAKDGSLFVTEDKNGDVLRVSFDAHLGNGAPMKPLPPQRPIVSADEKARCDALEVRTDAFSRVQRGRRRKQRARPRLKGQGFPQMPAGGVSPEQLQEVQSWVHDGALLPH